MADTIHARPLRPETYRRFGDVVSARPDLATRPANQGTATRFLDVAELQNLRGGGARPHLSIYRCEPAPKPCLSVTLLERHEHATQVFVPLSDDARYLVIVAPPGDVPDPALIEAFVVTGRTGITYHPGTWHHPMVALDQTTEFLCLVWEDATPEDCHERDVQGPTITW